MSLLYFFAEQKVKTVRFNQKYQYQREGFSDMTILQQPSFDNSQAGCIENNLFR